MPVRNIRRPVVGANATRYVLIMSVAFGISVVITRTYLELTGYPQIGNSTFHFAHALWGGLLLIISALLLLVFVNRWVNDLSAVLAGVGVGLFIDEVGKFITQQNDYFFPLAAPIIYVAFLLVLLISLTLHRRQKSHDLRVDMYQMLDELEEVLEADLSLSERDAMVIRLQRITDQTARPDLAELARSILTFLQSDAVTVIPDRPSRIKSAFAGLMRLEDRVFTRSRVRGALVILFLLNGLGTLFLTFVLSVVLIGDPSQIPDLMKSIFLNEANVTGITSLYMFLGLTLLELASGLLIFASGAAFLRKRDKYGVYLGAVATIIVLTFINTLSFYFSQFAMLFNSIYSFLVLLALERYRIRFLSENTPVQ